MALERAGDPMALPFSLFSLCIAWKPSETQYDLYTHCSQLEMRSRQGRGNACFLPVEAGN